MGSVEPSLRESPRARAWATRRSRYGPAGHGATYARWQIEPLGRYALNLVIHMHREATLSEGQCCKALHIDRVEFRRLVDAWPAYEHAFPSQDNRKDGSSHLGAFTCTYCEAASRLSAQAVEIEALRGALKPFAALAAFEKQLSCFWGMPGPTDVPWLRVWNRLGAEATLELEDFRRAALAVGGDGCSSLDERRVSPAAPARTEASEVTGKED